MTGRIELTLWTLWTVAGLAGVGCVGTPKGPPLSVAGKLSRAGLEEISGEEALLTDSEALRFLPIRVNDGAAYPAVPPDPAGYLIVGVAGKMSSDVQVIRDAIAAWGPGETLWLQVRRNPHLGPSNEWWEKDVRLPWP